MARMTKVEREVERRFDAAFRTHGHGVQINVMDLGKVSREFQTAIASGTIDDDAMIAVLAKYRQN